MENNAQSEPAASFISCYIPLSQESCCIPHRTTHGPVQQEKMRGESKASRGTHVEAVHEPVGAHLPQELRWARQGFSFQKELFFLAKSLTFRRSMSQWVPIWPTKVVATASRKKVVA